MDSWDELEAGFSKRMLDDLVENNVLRGAWAEELVAYHLGDCKFSKQWTYFDFENGGLRFSVKHSVGQSAKFDVAPRQFAWDPSVRRAGARAPYSVTNPEGWLGHKDGVPQHWCDRYVFAWFPLELDHADGSRSLELIRDPATWRFGALTRDHMYERFPPEQLSVDPPTWRRKRSVSLKLIGNRDLDFVPGKDLSALLARRAAEPVGAPAPELDRNTQETRQMMRASLQ